MDKIRSLRWLRSKTTRKKSRGQSIVEFMVLLPLLVMMLSGLIEFGFMLNFYLDLIDGAREIARFGANLDPLEADDGIMDCVNSTYFYRLLPCMADQVLSEQVVLNPATDDLVISAIAAAGGSVTLRLPDADGWSYKGNHVSKFTTADITGMLNAAAPATGMVMVEVYYDYHMVLGLPWITMFVPDTITLHAYSIMPNAYVEPTPTP
ncbi:MAG: hypothetical protein GQ524_10290 [Anaerolineales bacterium]|nr:hypothetical protein [Anaerolineales bacterium]